MTPTTAGPLIGVTLFTVVRGVLRGVARGAARGVRTRGVTLRASLVRDALVGLAARSRGWYRSEMGVVRVVVRGVERGLSRPVITLLGVSAEGLSVGVSLRGW